MLLLASLITLPVTGSYSTTSSGLPQVQKSISEFITRRDGGVPSHPEDIILTTGLQKSLSV